MRIPDGAQPLQSASTAQFAATSDRSKNARDGYRPTAHSKAPNYQPPFPTTGRNFLHPRHENQQPVSDSSPSSRPRILGHDTAYSPSLLFSPHIIPPHVSLHVPYRGRSTEPPPHSRPLYSCVPLPPAEGESPWPYPSSVHVAYGSQKQAHSTSPSNVEGGRRADSISGVSVTPKNGSQDTAWSQHSSREVSDVSGTVGP